MDIALRTNAGDPALAFHTIRRVGGTTYQCVLYLRSRGFVVERPFWFEEPQLRAFAEQLRTMDRTLSGEAELRTEYEDNFVHLVVSARGTVTVTGVATEYSVLGQQLRFAFETDQTVLAPLATDLAALLAGGGRTE